MTRDAVELMAHRDARESIVSNRMAGMVLGGVGAIATAILLVPVRTELDNTNLALVLVLVVVIAAIVGGRSAAAVTAVTATLAFDFFLAPPYLSMRLDSADDLETMLILLAVGLLVGEVSVRGRRHREHQATATVAIDRVQRVAELVVQGADLGVIVRKAEDEVRALLGLTDCWLEFPPYSWFPPRLERAGTLDVAEHRWSGGGFALPEDGLELPVVHGGRQVARLVLIGDPDVDVTLDERVLAVALADQLGSAFAQADPDQLRAVELEARRD